MKIYMTLSTMANSEGLCEILIRFDNGRAGVYRVKSGLFVLPTYFDYSIDAAKCHKEGINVNVKDVGKRFTSFAAEKKGYYLHRDGGIMDLGRYIETEEIKYHKDVKEKLEKLVKHIEAQYQITERNQINSKWLSKVIDIFNHPEKYAPKVKKVVRLSIYDLSEIYITKKDFSTDHTKALRVLFRDVARYEGFIRMTEKNRKKFTFDYDTITKNDIEDFADYLKNEYALAKEYPDIFKKLFNDYPTGISKGQSILEERGENTIIKLIRKLKAFFQWLYETDKTKNRPFEGIKIGAEKFGTPYYITIDERNEIADYDFTYSKHLETQRDIFIFHCFVGCRVGDLEKLTDENIINGILVYAPHKTKDEGEQTLQARVPLHPRALALIEKYRGADKFGRLFPFISAQKYNVAIKDIFTKVGITRNVVVRNATTGENEIRPINEIASSHLARRTFIGNAYKQVSDPNIIGRMSGHVEGSRAFTRYRNIEDDTLMNVINKLG
jgi:integrase